MINLVSLIKDLSDANGIEYAGSYFNVVLIFWFINIVLLVFGGCKVVRVNCVTILGLLGHRRCRESSKGKANVQR